MLTPLLAFLLFGGSFCARVKPFSPCYFEIVKMFQLHWLTCWKSGLEHKSFFHGLLKTSVTSEVESMEELSRTWAQLHYFSPRAWWCQRKFLELLTVVLTATSTFLHMPPSVFSALLPRFCEGWLGNNVVSNPSSHYERKSDVDSEVGHTINWISTFLWG